METSILSPFKSIDMVFPYSMGAITLISVLFLGIRNKINVEIISIIKNEKIKICFFFIISTFNLLTSYTLYEGLNKNINKKGSLYIK